MKEKGRVKIRAVSRVKKYKAGQETEKPYEIIEQEYEVDPDDLPPEILNKLRGVENGNNK